jgi:hypothetical protein
MFMKIATAILMLLNLASGQAMAGGTSDVANPIKSVQPDVWAGAFNTIGTSPREIQCLLMSDKSVRASDAMKTATDLSKAIKMMRFPPGTFTRMALLHFLSQIIKESDRLKTMEQRGVPANKQNKKGWGFLMVTGPENLEDSSKCASQCVQDDDLRNKTDMLSDLEGTVGNGADDRVMAGLISLCWWKTNMIDNVDHNILSSQGTQEASEKITQIVNAGAIGKKVTDGKKNLKERKKIFQNLLDMDQAGTCRDH